MNKLSIHFENCYGIKKLQHEFDFSKCRTFAVYSPNGVMKTSFTKTFDDVSANRTPSDQMDDSAISIFDIVSDETNGQIDAKDVCVIPPYNENAFDCEEKILTLLANEDLRNKYTKLYKELDDSRRSLITRLKKVSGSTNCEHEIIDTFSSKTNKGNIFEILVEILKQITAFEERFSFGKYNEIFDPTEKIKVFLTENYVLFEDYSKRYKDLITNSDFFSQSGDVVFGTTEANNIKKSIEGGEFFSVGHRLNLKKYGDVVSKDEFDTIFNNEINKIFDDYDLKKIFEKIDNKLNSNKELKAFKKLIEKNPLLLIRLKDYEEFKKNVWFSYLNELKIEVGELVNLFIEKKPELQIVINEANQQKSKWSNAIDEFHNRFVNIPFTLAIDNQSDAILNTRLPVVSFKFKGKPVDRKKLVQDILSTGEKRALYILNVIFDIRSRETSGQKTIFVIDDIADSFDYKNKYAIVEYLHDIASNPNFCSIILTHNYDFYRTITSRLNLQRNNKLHAIKTSDEIKILEEVYQKPPFVTWRNCMKSGKYYDKNYSDIDAKKHILALVPFVRNLIEYCGKNTNSTSYGSDYDVLTCLLHSKSITSKITFGDLKLIYKAHLDKDDFDKNINNTDSVYDQILVISDGIDNFEFNLENKIILAMAIRHKAEEYMLLKVSDKTPIDGSQTGVLFQRYKDDFLNDTNHRDKILTLESVNIMTPENIHLNSFMYEPILDMGIDELKSLYEKVSFLK